MSSGGLVQVEALPDLGQGGGQRFDIGVAVQRCRSQTQPLGAARHGRVIDRLDVNLVIAQQAVGRSAAQCSVAHHDRHDVAVVRHHWNPCGRETAFDLRNPFSMRIALAAALLQVMDRGERPGCQQWRQRAGKDEPRRVTAQEINQHCRAGDVAAHHPERLCEGALDDR